MIAVFSPRMYLQLQGSFTIYLGANRGRGLTVPLISTLLVVFLGEVCLRRLSSTKEEGGPAVSVFSVGRTDAANAF